MRELLVAIFLCSLPLRAQEIPHEFVIPDNAWVDQALPRILSSISTELPVGIQVGDELISAMVPPAAPQGGEPLFAGRGDVPSHLREQSGLLRRKGEVTMDLPSGGPDRLHYFATFNPSVVPFKRFEVYDEIQGDGDMTVHDGSLRPLPLVGNRFRADRDVFYGQISLYGGPGEAAPIPSVSTDMALLGVQVDPPGEVDFFVDGVENYWVRPRKAGMYRLILAVDAPRTYFGGPLPPVSLAEMPGSLQRPLPGAFQKRALEVARRIGVNRHMDLEEILLVLVRHFRSFKDGAVEQGGAGVVRYERMALSRVGACRHRAYAFMVTALALGIPCRYVANEAHAFVEVFIPPMGFRRIDLGGTASDLNVQGGEERVLHEPKTAPAPWDGDHHQGAALAATRVNGLPRRARRGEGVPGAGGSSPGEAPGQLSLAPGAQGDPGRGSTSSGGRPPGEGGPESFPGEAVRGEESLSPPGPPRHPSSIRLLRGKSQVFRGGTLLVKGQVLQLSEGSWTGAGRVPVEIHLLGEGGDEISVASGQTTDRGEFSITCRITSQVRLGRYQVQALTAGSDEIAPSASDLSPLGEGGVP